MGDKICNIDRHRCLVELHCHLDGALSLKSFRKLAEMQKLEIPDSDEELRNILMVPKGCRSLNEFLEKFEFPNRVLQTAESISCAVYHLLTEMQADGYIYAEVRFAPQLSMRRGLTQDQVVEAAIEGLNRSEMKAQLILCCMRGDNTHELNLETVRTAGRFLGRGVCAVDLAGAEALFPTKDFREEFVLANKLGIPITIHAGEADGPESVTTALNFGAARIGHGVRSFEDPDVVKRLSEEKIPLELCPTSNLLTGIYRDISEYPVRRLMEAGIPVSVSTDDPTCCNTDLRSEWKLLIDTFRLTEREAEHILLDTADASFADAPTREWLKARIREDFADGKTTEKI